MSKFLLILFGVLFATATAKQFATSVYANDFANAAAAQYSAGNTLAYSNFAAPVGLGGWGYPGYGLGGYGYGYPYDLGIYGGLYGAPIWGGPVSSTNFYSNNYNNAAAAQYSTGNTLAATNFAAPIGLGWGYPYWKRQ